MSPKTERRQADRRSSDDDLSPEYLALLDVCGGEIRAGDRARLSSHRKGLPGQASDTPADQVAVAEAAPVTRDRRSSKR